MPLTPDEVMRKNMGKIHLQLDRAIQALLSEAEEAIQAFTGGPIYVGLPAYLLYKVQADNAAGAGQVTLEAVVLALREQFGPSGWKVGIVNNESKSYYWAKLMDGRKG
jgi:hypothetical protein